MWYQKLKKQKPHLERSEELSQRLEKKKKKKKPQKDGKQRRSGLKIRGLYDTDQPWKSNILIIGFPKRENRENEGEEIIKLFKIISKNQRA